MYKVKQAIFPYIELMRLNKPIGSYLLLWPTLTALWLASNGNPSLKLIIIFTLGVILTRSAGCVINDFADRNFDAYVDRSKNRPLATKKISTKSALILFVLLLITCLILVIQTNYLTISFATLAVILMIIYPFTKRYTNAPQFFLGLAYASGIPMAFAAQNNTVDLASLWLVGFTIIWAIVYDTMYAMVDRQDDLKIGIKSTAILFLPFERIYIAGFQGLMVVCLIMVGVNFQLTLPYYLGITATVPIMIYHHYLIKNYDITLCFKAFLHNHWLGLVLFIGTVISYLF